MEGNLTSLAFMVTELLVLLFFCVVLIVLVVVLEMSLQGSGFQSSGKSSSEKKPKLILSFTLHLLKKRQLLITAEQFLAAFFLHSSEA